MALASQQRTLTVLLLVILVLCILLFGESLARGLVGLFQLGGHSLRGSLAGGMVAERQQQRAEHVKQVLFI